MVDDEVVSHEAARDDRSRRERLDDQAVVALFQLVAGRSRSIGRVGQDLEPVGLSFHELDTDRSVGDIGRSELHRGDDPGVGLGGQDAL